MKEKEKLSELDIAIFSYIDDNCFTTARELSIELKVDLALIYKSLNMLSSLKYISSNGERPKGYKSLKNE